MFADLEFDIGKLREMQEFCMSSSLNPINSSEEIWIFLLEMMFCLYCSSFQASFSWSNFLINLQRIDNKNANNNLNSSICFQKVSRKINQNCILPTTNGLLQAIVLHLVILVLLEQPSFCIFAFLLTILFVLLECYFYTIQFL